MHAGCVVLLLATCSLGIIDHGHFQYNCISLGLALFGVVAMVHNWNMIGSAWLLFPFIYWAKASSQNTGG